jgi:hypothetical protein
VTKKLFVVFSYDCSPSKGEGKSLLGANFVLKIKEMMISLPDTKFRLTLLDV